MFTASRAVMLPSAAECASRLSAARLHRACVRMELSARVSNRVENALSKPRIYNNV